MGNRAEAWNATLADLTPKGFSAHLVSASGELTQIEGKLPDAEPFFLHCRGNRCWLGIGGDEPESAPYWQWMIRRRAAGEVLPEEAVSVLMLLYQRYLADREAALEADTTWWNLRHRPHLDEGLALVTGGLALSWRGASEPAITNLQRRFHLRFPDDYVRFMRASNGAEGEVGSAWLQLWTLEMIEKQNAATNGPLDRVFFGSNGESTGYAFAAGPTTEIVDIPLDSRSSAPTHARGKTLVEFLASLLTRPPAEN